MTINNYTPSDIKILSLYDESKLSLSFQSTGDASGGWIYIHVGSTGVYGYDLPKNKPIILESIYYSTSDLTNINTANTDYVMPSLRITASHFKEIMIGNDLTFAIPCTEQGELSGGVNYLSSYTDRSILNMLLGNIIQRQASSIRTTYPNVNGKIHKFSICLKWRK